MPAISNIGVEKNVFTIVIIIALLNRISFIYRSNRFHLNSKNVVLGQNLTSSEA